MGSEFSNCNSETVSAKSLASESKSGLGHCKDGLWKATVLTFELEYTEEWSLLRQPSQDYQAESRILAMRTFSIVSTACKS